MTANQLTMLGVDPNPRPKRGLAGAETKNGYWMDEVRSAIQKAIRRGQEEEALFWAKEFASIGWTKYLWKTLFGIVVEDIGIANPDLPGQILSLKQMSDFITEGKFIESDCLAMAILLMCQSPKNREAADFDSYISHRRKQGWRLEVPDEALDGHTHRGREMGRGEDFFQAVGRKVVPEVGELTYKAKLAEAWQIEEMV